MAVPAWLSGLGQSMGGGQGISQALQATSPLLLSMAAGLRSGQGAAAGMPLGLAQMMQQQRDKSAKDAKAAASASYGAWNAGGNSGGGPMLNGGFTGAGMGDRNAPDPMAGKPRVSAAASAGGTPKLVFDTLTSQGMPAHIAHGVLGNLKQESGFNSGAYNEKEGAFGLGQWRGGRLENLKRYAQAQGKEISDATVQAEFIGHELSTTESAAWEKIQRAKTPEEAAAAFDQHYERSSGEHTAARVKNATEYAQGFQSTFGETAPPADPRDDPQVQQMLGWLAQHGEADPAMAQAVRAELDMRVAYLGQANSGQGISDAQAIQFGLTEAGQQRTNQDNRYKVVGGALVDLAPAGGGDPRPVFTDTGQADPMSTIGKLQADLNAGRITQELFDMELARMAPQGMSIESDGSGGFRMIQGAGVSGAGGGLKPATGYAVVPQGDGTVKQAPIAGGPATVMPAEIAGRIALAKDSLLMLPSLIGQAKSGDLTGPMDWIKGYVGRGQQGVSRRENMAASEAITRILTGAGMPASEAEREKDLYVIGPKDNAESAASKLTQLQRRLEALVAMAERGRGDAVPVDAATGLGVPNAPGGLTTMPDEEMFKLYGVAP